MMCLGVIDPSMACRRHCWCSTRKDPYVFKFWKVLFDRIVQLKLSRKREKVTDVIGLDME